ncbi:winged helix-turn-helix transcriptional regulator [Desulfallas sp. Bu1-1]|jgi:ArsR family transcriptional regulator|uniref:ArsR/SmtB family transcription factor n=1 Tax=Desulfallas sp. Bu1-1 TaxID=2787620 RepID=UPI00189C6F17|nr:metalloregulator ArsR/SmtB family transcription factor [Desulfallas sp. Bu1-1]MBF7082883.1 winged helix-turn-helix transcriptional regulator [Desulfallas sp. Bu1-1]
MDSVKIAKALSDPIRYRIMLLLARSEGTCCATNKHDNHRYGMCNCELMTELGMIQSRVSYHMKELTGAGLVTEEPRGKWKFYSINKKTLQDYLDQLNKDFTIKTT